jgi:molybdopterin molybdotransferase
LARDVVALLDVPHYASSAMDGWAVAGSAPWTIAASAPLRSGECLPVVTGAVVPEGASAILRSENAVQFREGAVDRVAVVSEAPGDPRAGEHIRVAGTEATTGETLIAAGTVLNAAHLALAASAGHDGVAVVARPRVRLVLTGNEVVLSGIPAAGQVRDSFGPVLPFLIEQLGGVAVGTVHLGDSRSSLIDALSANPDDSDILITTGSTGHSSADHLRRALSDLGATLLLDGIRMRPGGPTLLARLEDGRYLIGLPGNPRAAILALLTVAEPLFDALTGGPPPRPHSVAVEAGLSGHPGVSLLVPYRWDGGRAVVTGWSGSAMMRGLATSDGVMVCPPGGVGQSESVEAFPLPWAGAVSER